MILERVLPSIVSAILREYGLSDSDPARVSDVTSFVARQLRRAPDVLRRPIAAAVLSLRLGPVELTSLRASKVQARRDALRLVESLVVYRWYDDSAR